MASYMWRYAMASYGWKGLNFIGKGNGIFSDAVRSQSDALSICEHLDIPKEDLLAYELRTSAAFRPSYYIARDRKLNAIVLSIRGTMVMYYISHFNIQIKEVLIFILRAHSIQ
jgi:hypothetical protein